MSKNAKLLARAMIALAMSLSASSVRATPVAVNQPYQWLNVESTNTLGRPSGLSQLIGAQAVEPNGLNGTTATATQGSTSIALPYDGTTTFPNEFSTRVAATPSLFGPWTLSFTNGSNVTTVTTPGITATTPLPFLSSVALTSNNGTTASFSWSVPAGVGIDAVRVNLLDHNALNLAGTFADNVFNATYSPTTTTLTLPSVLNNGLGLIAGHLYTLELSGIDSSNNAVSFTQTQILRRSRVYVDFVPLATPGIGIYLPIVQPGVDGAPPLFRFDIDSVDTNRIFIDPLIATGYAYSIGAGDPNFASVLLPSGIGDNRFTIELPNATLIDATGGTAVDFGAGGISSFRVLGIEVGAGLDASDPSAFVTGLTFTGPGHFTGTMQAIVAIGAVPEPSSIALVLLGMAGLGARDLRRQRRSRSRLAPGHAGSLRAC